MTALEAAGVVAFIALVVAAFVVARRASLHGCGASSYTAAAARLIAAMISGTEPRGGAAGPAATAWSWRPASVTAHGHRSN
jgi:hypothetical protein